LLLQELVLVQVLWVGEVKFEATPLQHLKLHFLLLP